MHPLEYRGASYDDRVYHEPEPVDQALSLKDTASSDTPNPDVLARLLLQAPYRCWIELADEAEILPVLRLLDLAERP